MRELGMLKQIKFGWLVFVLALVGCGEELEVGNDAQEQVINSDTPFAYVARDLNEEQSSKLEKDMTADAYLPGSRLYVRSNISSMAEDSHILEGIFEGPYDVKNLSVSDDGRYLLFSAHGGSQEDSWNLYEYDFEQGAVRTIISETDVANLGDDISGVYVEDDILFLSNRNSANTSDFSYYRISRNGEDLTALPSERSLSQTASTAGRITRMKDGHIMFAGRAEVSRECGDTKGQVCAKSIEQESKTDLTVLRMTPQGGDAKPLFNETTLHKDIASNLKFDQLTQGNGGYLMAIAKHKDNNLLGGQLISLRGPKADPSADSEYKYVQAESLDEESLGNAIPNNGVYSSFTPYRDGSERVLVSWSQCMIEDAGRYRKCLPSDETSDVKPRYGVWIYDAQSNIRMPIIQGQANRVYTELALAYPNQGENLSYDENIERPEPVEPEPVEPDPVEPDPVEPDPVDPNGPDRSN